MKIGNALVFLKLFISNNMLMINKLIIFQHINVEISIHKHI